MMKEIQRVDTAYGEVTVQCPIYYDNGGLKAAEPAEPVFIKHDTGLYIAFDNTPLKDEAHPPTLELDEEGRIKSLRTVGTGLICTSCTGERLYIGAEWRPDPRGTGANVLIPIRIQFEAEGLKVTDSDGKEINIPYDGYTIDVDYLTDNIVMAGGCGDCSSCNGCHV